MNRIAFLLLAGMAANGAAAQTPSIYRCGNAYSQAPCATGRAVDADDSRSEAQRADAARVTAEVKRSAAQMERDRLAEEARRKPEGPSHLSAAPAAARAALVARHVKRTRRLLRPRLGLPATQATIFRASRSGSAATELHAAELHAAELRTAAASIASR